MTFDRLRIFHYENGIKAPEIAKLWANKIDRSTVHRCKQSESINVMPKSERPRKERMKCLINLIKQQPDSQVRRKSLRTMAKNFKRNFGTIRRVVTDDLGKKCYRKMNVQKLKQNQKPIRKSC